MPELPELDPIVHAPVRLAVLSLLATLDEAEFTHLRERVGATDGNLSVHLTKLEEAGYVAVKKGFAGKKPRSTYRLTERGRAAFLAYVKHLKSLLAAQL
ncbi:MAG: transcriptional regulator [Anaeromyxobacteraceae bacterium]